ncbi:MAG TPA: phospholipase D-like domain-containing protein [Panacibacter sp.]|nr:phospholipase D-like domain-containing protein [Panacibacter sp.]
MFSFKSKTDPEENQIAIHNGLEIFEKIKVTLNEAQFSIKIAAAWFTDNELFQLLVAKQKANPSCKIEIVLDDNKENYWLPFIDLVKNGATVKLSKGVGDNGRMHEKFCIVDNAILISGSYNWSKNARTDNHENVIVSKISSTIESFDAKFKELLASSVLYESVNLNEISITSEEALSAINTQESLTKEFEKVLDEMIFASVVAYNRDELVKKGYERSEKCSGDSAIINNELNTVYTELLNSISTSEQKKEIIKAKVNTHLQENKSALKEKCERAKEQLKVEEDTIVKAHLNEIKYLKEGNDKLKEEITQIEKFHILNNNNRINNLMDEKKSIEEQTLTMPFRWYVEIPTYLALLGVFFYILLFYSSAAYILMFSERNAKAAKLLGQPVEQLGIYYSKAIPNAWQSSWFEVSLILFVPVFLICGIIYLKKIETSRYFPKWLIKLLGLFFIDGFTAIAVTKSIHENNYLAGLEAEHFKISNIFSEMNFYLVFIFGMLSLLIFDLIISYILKNLENKNEVYQKAKSRLFINQLNSEISTITKQNLELSAMLTNKKALIDSNLYRVSIIEKDIQLQPGFTSRKLNLLDNETASQIINLENIVKIAYNKIDNELFSFSTHFMKDRINIFLQGWNNFIYSYYSKSISEEKVRLAKEMSNNWFNEHFGNLPKK